ncbi:hypothetical protein [Flagellimonas crocea]|uniref:hypothetical protein n=1 Tax=Flagellimonas crocea TaxID=3067311 RepID=UPI00296E9D76|nr:hypothetical protein [Muricauda sp. DH64]
MAFSDEYNSKRNPRGPKVFEATEGLDDFLKALERYFFATAKLRCKQDIIENRLNLIVELDFNFGIADCLRHFNNGDWSSDGFTQESGEDISLSVTNALDSLNEKSTYPADIMEISMHFTDTSIIISRLYHKSISEHIGNILTTLSRHFIYFTKGLTEMPYEIFVPVFEDISLEISSVKINTNYSYFNYWGLYFDKGPEHEALIYSLEKKKLYEENIFLLE